ncbi:MAG: hypothetical protein ABEJ67_01675 [Halanaeroarchaeum sp.]
MNKHFEDARYYLKRAVETAAEGVREELEPLEGRFREMTGSEDEEPAAGRLESIQSDLKDLEARAEGDARDQIKKAREQISTYRSGQ